MTPELHRAWNEKSRQGLAPCPGCSILVISMGMLFWLHADALAQNTSHGRNYDEAEVRSYVVPDPLLGKNGRRATDAQSWRYCDRFRDYIDREEDLPFDQHMLLGLIAPRPVYVSSATEDLLADPKGEFLTALHAEPVYRLFGLSGVGTVTWPPPDTSIGQSVGYHRRTGKHAITAYDWEQFLSFAERHFNRNH